MTYKRWSFTESMVISPTLRALMSCLSSSLGAPEVPFCLGSSALLTLLPSETWSNKATIWKCSDKRTKIQYIHYTLMSTYDIRPTMNFFVPKNMYLPCTFVSKKKYGKRVALTTGKRTLMRGIQFGSTKNGNKIAQIIKPEVKSIQITWLL